MSSLGPPKWIELVVIAVLVTAFVLTAQSCSLSNETGLPLIGNWLSYLFSILEPGEPDRVCFSESATPHTPKTPVRPRLFMSAALFLFKTGS